MSRSYKLSLIVITLLMLASTLISLVLPNKVNAVSASDWNPGRIIDDAIFYNKDSMTVAQIQQFLDAKVPSCDRDRASSNPSYQPPWTCLKEYQENTTTKENNIGRFNGNGTPYQVPGGKSAAQIIWEVGQNYGINPQVLIVMLQKEQSLITDNWPWKIQYDRAMGYACPDTAPCDAQYYGFYNQVSRAAWQLKRYVQYPDNYNFKSGVYRNILFNPNTSCGTTNVYIENTATAALYNYTPYQPNAAALNNLYGTGDGCSAYGNRNFWRMFNDWFGSTKINFVSFSKPRWMQLNRNTYKLDAISVQQVDGELALGQRIKFASKVYINNEACYRTQNDTDKYIPKCIPSSHISELNIMYEALEESDKVKAIIQDTNKVNLRTSALGQRLYKDRQIIFDSKYTIGGKTYFITAYDRNNGFENGVLQERLRNSNKYEAIDLTWYKINKDSNKVYPTDSLPVDAIIPENTEISFTSRTNVSGTWYYRTSHDTSRSLDKAIPFSDLDEITFTSFAKPRFMELITDTYKINTNTGQKIDSKLSKGQDIMFTEKITLKGKTYYRSAHDTAKNLSKGILAEEVKEIPTFPFASPRWMLIKADTTKIIARTNATTAENVVANTQFKFTSKMSIGSKTFFRTEEDHIAGKDYWLESIDTKEVTFDPMVTPRYLTTKEELRKKVPSQESEIDGTLNSGKRIYFKDKITVNGVTYLRTAHDSEKGYNKGIELSKLE